MRDGYDGELIASKAGGGEDVEGTELELHSLD